MLIVYHLGDLSTPYAKRIASSQITLGEFKVKIFAKNPGDYRYVFVHLFALCGKYCTKVKILQVHIAIMNGDKRLRYLHGNPRNYRCLYMMKNKCTKGFLF